MKSLKNHLKNSTQQGMALVQVLLISTIIAVLLIIVVTHTQQQQKQVLALNQTLEQRQKLYSQTNEILFTLLTQPLISQRPLEHPLADNWNFYGEPLYWQDTEIRLYNLASLINLQADFASLKQLLVTLGKGASQAEDMAKHIQLRQQPFLNRNTAETLNTVLPIQHLSELASLPGWDNRWQQKVSPFIALIPYAGKSPAYLPNTMLDLVLSETKTAMIRTARAQQVQSYQGFYALTGIEPDEFTLLSPGPYLRLELNCCADSKGQRLRRQIDIKLDPYNVIALEKLSIIDHQ